MDRASFGNCILSIGAFWMGPASGVALNPGRSVAQSPWSASAGSLERGGGGSRCRHWSSDGFLSSAILVPLLVVALDSARCVRRNHGRARDRVEAPLTGPDIREARCGALPVYRRSIGTTSCIQDEVVAEIKADGVICHIRASMSIPGLLPRRPDSRSYESGQNAGGQIGREWTAPATKVDKTPVRADDVTRAGFEAGIRASGCSITVLGLRRWQRRMVTQGPQLEGRTLLTGEDWASAKTPYRMVRLHRERWTHETY